ncbi:hypothetical protein BDN70DRAFT_810414 [Pholiota conissans]|uniref:F-box only protein 9 n=1 Tax=Pholiota conissans TaxID=109636 RepID=A0A9P5YZL2_9AGAR|nr:hypothetical protein BDN70DRAFT_810414 [Pholiota conissans]
MSTSTLAQAPAKGKLKVDAENPDLIRFREEWLAELRRQGKQVPATVVSPNSEALSSHGAAGAGKAAVAGIFRAAPGPSVVLSALSGDAPKQIALTRTLPASHPAIKNGGVTTKQSHAFERALEVYRQAIEHEQRGELDDALLLYRQAFRMHDNVDRVYQREQMLKSILKGQQELRNGPSNEIEEISASFESVVTIKPRTINNKAEVVVTGSLATIIKDYATDLKFEQENDKEPVFLNMLPEELLVMIIMKLDPTSVERFALVNKKARILTLESGIWRALVQRTYRPPQIPDVDTLLTAVETCLNDFRRVFIEQPRLRLDGVYIATCHYVRPGLSENHWVNISHLITYHRYLRFFPNGQVLSLLANEEHAPQHVIPLLKPTLRMKGLFLGQWQLIGTIVNISNLIDASGRYAVPEINDSASEISAATITPASGASGAPTRYVFTMTLDLRSRPLGRWNRMDIQSYNSVNLDSGDVDPVALKHERPFWFSKVRSYTY